MSTSFWDQIAPGIGQAGGGMLSSYFTGKDDENRLKRAQDPLYGQAMGQARQSLGLAGAMDPVAAAKQRFEQQQGLMAPGRERDMQSLQRRLAAQGQGGIASFEPVPGTVAAPGQSMNPQMAAMLAAQEGAKSQSAYDALSQGEQQLDRLIGRSGMLQQQAQGQRASNLATQPRRPSFGSQVAGAMPGILGNKQVMGMLGKGIGRLFEGFGGGGRFGQFSGGDEWAPFQRVDAYYD